MPPKRRSTGPAAAGAARNPQQGRISFKGQSTRVTKPTAATGDVKKSLVTKPVVTQKGTHSEPAAAVSEPATAEPSVPDRVGTELPDPVSRSSTTEDVLGGRAPPDARGATDGPTRTGWVSDEEARARRTTQKQIGAYWAAKEAARKAPRVHQQDLSLSEKILREWDMSGQYGPCVGIARLKRWKRASSLGLSPPIEVLAVLLQGLDGADASKIQRAHVDELLSARFVDP